MAQEDLQISRAGKRRGSWQLPFTGNAAIPAPTPVTNYPENMSPLCLGSVLEFTELSHITLADPTITPGKHTKKWGPLQFRDEKTEAWNSE